MVGTATSKTWKHYYVNPAQETDKFLDIERVEVPVIVHSKGEVRMSGKGDATRRLCLSQGSPSQRSQLSTRR